MAKKTSKSPKQVEAFKHDEASRKNIPTAEFESVMAREAKTPIQVAIERRNRDLDPQLVWRGKDEKDASDLVVQAPPIYIQEKVHPKALIDDLRRQTEKANSEQAAATSGFQADFFGDFNGVPKGADKTEFYQHDGKWQNRMILGDSLQVMASLAEREGLRGKVQCIYIDPPYGIKFNSNFQWSTTSRDVKDGNVDHITREPEQVRAFRDTWRDGIHSYLSYLRDRLTVARELLTESGSIFVQIGDENVHRVRAMMDEVFGEDHCIAEILVKKKGSQKGGALEPVNDFILWYGRKPKASGAIKIRPLYEVRTPQELIEDFPFVQFSDGTRKRVSDVQQTSSHSESRLDMFLGESNAKLFAANPLKSGGFRRKQSLDFTFQGRVFPIRPGQCWKHTVIEDDERTPGMTRLAMADRLVPQETDVRFVRHSPTPSIREISNWWDGFGGAPNQVYVVQTNERILQRCILLASDPGDLVLDPTCGSGTTAFVAEQWARRWIVIDTSRVALALARARLMGARYGAYLLADSIEGQTKEAELDGRPLAGRAAVQNSVRHGFVCERVKNVTSASIANNTEVDVIWQRYQQALEPLRQGLNQARGQTWEEWQVPRDPSTGSGSGLKWTDEAKQIHSDWWQARIARQKEIDASIAAKADTEYLYDKPYEDNRKVRVAGPFTVESLSPHRVLGVDEDDELLDSLAETAPLHGEGKDFATMVIENLKTSGVQQAHKTDKITFTSIVPWPGKYIAAEGRYVETETRESERVSAKASDKEGSVTARGGGAPRHVANDDASLSMSAPRALEERRAAIFIGPEFGTVSKPDLTAAAREAGDAGFDVVIACAFNYDAHSAEFDKLGRIPVLKARMNADLHMAGDLKNTGKGNLFVVFGEPDIDILPVKAEPKQIQVKINGVDVFHPQTGEVRSDGPEGIACWFIDTDYNEESFFVRHAYFLGANDPYKSLKTTLKAEINEEAWASLQSDTSRPFEKPTSGRIAVKVINHLGDEVMKVFRVE